MVKRARYEGADMVKGLEVLEELKKGYDGHLRGRFEIIEKELEILEIIYNSPFIIDNLAELGKLPPEAKQRYLFGTITNRDVQKVEDFFKDAEMRNKSK